VLRRSSANEIARPAASLERGRDPRGRRVPAGGL